MPSQLILFQSNSVCVLGAGSTQLCTPNLKPLPTPLLCTVAQLGSRGDAECSGPWGPHGLSREEAVGGQKKGWGGACSVPQAPEVAQVNLPVPHSL